MEAQLHKQRHTPCKQVLIAMVWLVLSLCLSTAHAQSITGGQNSLLSGPRFLPAEQAFNFYTSLPEPGVLKLHWTIAPGYYLYQDKFALHAEVNGKRVSFALQLPEAIAHNDEFFGDVMVYFDAVVAQVDMKNMDQEGDITLSLQYQGCAEAGFCYTVQHQEIPLAF
ncbi:MAG: protein-disulfide reductase DsbD N-terminal domain-containing protein [Gammaproteobacteria bacterium]